MNAQGASLQGETLTLNGVAPSSIVFADRPVRAAGHMPTTHLLAGWSGASEGFAENPPNATVSVFSKDNATVHDAVVVLNLSGSRAIAKSGSVDWVDPFVGARLRQQLARGQEFVLRGDVGGFGAGSQFSWQAIATYNAPLCEIHGIPVDSYVGFRALSADFSQGSGRSKFEWDNVIYGPVIGATMRF